MSHFTQNKKWKLGTDMFLCLPTSSKVSLCHCLLLQLAISYMTTAEGTNLSL